MPDIDAVTRLIETVAREEVLPRFRRLQAGEVERKSSLDDPDDIVTAVDRRVEARLSDGLSAIFPSAAILGEESAHARPELLALMNSDKPLWIIDPIDGTKNFARGDERFGIMVSLAIGGATRAAWVHLPAHAQSAQSYVAESGSGTYLNGVRVAVSPQFGQGELRGTIHSRYMPNTLRDAVLRAASGNFQEIANSGCAAIEYTEILRGVSEFTIYYRLLPWDHGAPALILSEAGGCVQHMNGQPYSVRSQNQLTIVARDSFVFQQVRAFLPAPSRVEIEKL